MKGCLSLIIKIIIAVLVFFGLVHIGAIDFIKEKINNYQNPSQEQLIENTKDIIDLSGIGEEYSVEKNFKILKTRMIFAEHNASGQKMIIIEPKDDDILTKADLESGNFEEKLNQILSKKQYKFIKFEKLKVTKQGTMRGLNQEIPYVKITADISNLPIKSVEGIVGSAYNSEAKNLIIISVNEQGKYSQIITEAFYNKVK